MNTVTECTYEAWEAWEDGKRDESVIFLAPIGGTHDIASAGAEALGVDVSEYLNVSKIK